MLPLRKSFVVLIFTQNWLFLIDCQKTIAKKPVVLKFSEVELVVFDLDYVLWPFSVDSENISPPLKINEDEIVEDKHLNEYFPYRESTKVLKVVNDKSLKVAGIGSVTNFHIARQFIYLFGWDDLIKYKVIESLGYSEVLENLKKITGTPYKKMLLFAGSPKNAKILKQLGIYTAVLQRGITFHVLRRVYEHFYLRFGINRTIV